MGKKSTLIAKMRIINILFLLFLKYGFKNTDFHTNSANFNGIFIENNF